MENKKIIRYDNVFSDKQIDIIWSEYLTQPKWSFWHTSCQDSNNFFWIMDFNDSEFFTKELFSRVKELVGEEYYLNSVYANGQTFGLDGDFHIDDPDDNAYTFLYYPMNDWDLSWGGETVIIDESGESKNIYPKPNSSVVFPSNFGHCGKAPSKLFSDLRITIAFKLKK